MFGASRRAAWLASAALHAAALLLILEYPAEIATPQPADRTKAVLIFNPPPIRRRIRPPLPAPAPRAFQIPKVALARAQALAAVPSLNAPLLQTSAPTRLPEPLIPAAIIPAPARPEVQTGGFAQILHDEPKLRRMTAPEGFGGATAASSKAGSVGLAAVSEGAFGRASKAAGEPARQAPQTSIDSYDTAIAKPQASTARQAAPAAPDSSALEITFTPKPLYTPEARKLQIEGEVLLEVVFMASGEVRILKTVRGLGHGLDESAMKAARSIHFRPAREQGHAVDSKATVHMTFQLAY